MLFLRCKSEIILYPIVAFINRNIVSFLFRKKLYQSLYEYDVPLFYSDPCRFEFENVSDCEQANPWKDSFLQLYRGVHVRQGYQDLQFEGRQVPFFNTIQAALDYVDEKSGNPNENGDIPLIFIHSGTYTGEFLVIDCDVSLIGTCT